MSLQADQFKADARRLTADLRHRALIQTAMSKYEPKRDQNKALFQDWEKARQLAADIKWESIHQLDTLLEQLAKGLESRGAKVHWAGNAQEARAIIVGICQEKKARCVVKSKAMTGEEIHLNEALEHAGLEVVESDLGEFTID